jgi:N-acetylglucosaminyl-diphospho-decaprenol L-rhamnosyltransferase
MTFHAERTPIATTSHTDTTATPKVVVIIVGYNEKHLLAGCLGSLLAIQDPSIVVVYVDNDSSDGSLDYAKVMYPSVVAISSGGNLGYCGGNNAGLEYALATGAEYVVIQNPDTVVFNCHYIAQLRAYLQNNPTVGKAGPLVYLREPGQIQNTIMDWPSILGSIGSVISRAPVDGIGGRSAITHTATEVPVLNGCCFMVRSQAVRDVGLYDPNFWCYVDEADWDWRAEQQGWKRHFVPIESIVHLQKKDGYERGSRAEFLTKRNTATWFLKAGKIGSMLVWMAYTLTFAVVRIAAAPIQGKSLAVAAAYAGKLAVAYAGILVKVPSRLCGAQGVAPSTHHQKNLLDDRRH